MELLHFGSYCLQSSVSEQLQSCPHGVLWRAVNTLVCVLELSEHETETVAVLVLPGLNI